MPSSRALLAVVVAVFVALASGAMLQSSATFDEILFPAAGARALETGDFTLVRDHPRLPQYLYGVPAWLTHPRYPVEDGTWSHDRRYPYARTFFFGVGNSPQKLAFVARLVAVLIGAGLIVATFLVSRAYLGERWALVAATLVAFTPDVLAHSGISYNDVPVALALLVAVHAIDRAIRRPGAKSAAIAGIACGFALAVKTTALVLLPIALVLVALHALAGSSHRAGDRRPGLIAAIALPIAAYVTLVAVYLGDPALREWIDVVRLNLLHVKQGHAALEKGLEFPAYLLGEKSQTGWWYYFPVALALKTPAAFQLLVVLAVAGGVMVAWRAGQERGAHLASIATHPLRAPAVAAVALAATLLTSHLDIGTRHALPLVPFACILVAAGLRVVATRWRGAAIAVGVLVAAQVGSVAASYPFFLPYMTEWARSRPAYELISDSSVDWGQGLIALDAYMEAHGIDQVALSYFGSALPGAYGIHYHPLPSHYLVPGNPANATRPRYAAISLTNLAGNYFEDDPFAALRSRKPVAVVGGVFWIYELKP